MVRYWWSLSAKKGGARQVVVIGPATDLYWWGDYRDIWAQSGSGSATNFYHNRISTRTGSTCSNHRSLGTKRMRFTAISASANSEPSTHGT